MIKKGILIGIMMAVLSLAINSCNFDAFTEEEDRNLRMVYTNWSEGVAITHLAKILLTDKMDYKVDLKLTDVESAYDELANSETDVFADAWLPETQKKYFEKHKDKLNRIGIIYPEARTGFVVPDYSRFQSVKDLKNCKHDIIGIDAGAGVMQQAKKAIEKYELPMQLLELSEEVMTQRLADSIKRKKEVVVTGWEPHWIFARYDVRFLKDEDKIFGEKENIYSISRLGMEEDHPRILRFFERMQLTEKQLNNLVYYMRLNEDPEVGIKEWINQNEYVVNQWVKDLGKERKKIM